MSIENTFYERSWKHSVEEKHKILSETVSQKHIYKEKELENSK